MPLKSTSVPLGVSILFISVNLPKECVKYLLLSHLADKKAEIQESLLTVVKSQKAMPDYKPTFFGIQNPHLSLYGPEDCSVGCRM